MGSQSNCSSVPVAIDLLKIDVDNGDCDFLEVALKRPGGLDPMLLHVEMNHWVAAPPPIAVRHRFDEELEYPPNEDISASRRQILGHRGCSVAAIAAIVPGYILFQ